MKRIKTGFGAQRPGSEQYSQWGPWDSGRGKREGREEKGQGSRERGLTWNCQEAERPSSRLGIEEQSGSQLTSWMALKLLPPTQINTVFASLIGRDGKHRKVRTNFNITKIEKKKNTDKQGWSRLSCALALNLLFSPGQIGICLLTWWALCTTKGSTPSASDASRLVSPFTSLPLSPGYRRLDPWFILQ